MSMSSGSYNDQDYYRIVKGGPQMAKTYVPQMARMALKLNNYLIKHNAKLQQYITDPNAKAALSSCPQCLASLAALYQREQP
jgi:hypothetical protein